MEKAVLARPPETVRHQFSLKVSKSWNFVSFSNVIPQNLLLKTEIAVLKTPEEKFLPRGRIIFARIPKLWKKLHFLTNKSSENQSQGSFDNQTKSFSPEGRKNFVQSPKKNEGIWIYQKNCWHAECSFETNLRKFFQQPSQFFSLKWEYDEKWQIFLYKIVTKRSTWHVECAFGQRCHSFLC